MAFKMGMTKEDLSGPPPVPPGMYDLQITNFRPKLTKDGDGLNYNVELTVVNQPEYENRKVFHPLSTKFGISIYDFVHSAGLEMEERTVVNDEGQPETEMVMPGVFENADKFPEEPEKWGKYRGPLTNKIIRVELTQGEYNGRPKNEIRCFLCVLPNCATLHPDIKHATNLIKA